MLQKLGPLIVDALERAAAADQRARDAIHRQDRLFNESQAQRWRALARSYQIVESIKQFVLTSPKKRDLRRSRPEPPSDHATQSFLFRCPVKGSGVHGFFIEEVPSDDPISFNAVSCLDCGQIHLVDFRTGKTVGDAQRDR